MSLFELFKKPKPLDPMKTSPGKLNLYLQCPLKYKYVHIEKRRAKSVGTHHLEFYKLLQDSIQNYQHQLIQPSKNIRKNALADAIQSKWSDERFQDADDIDAMRNEAMQAGLAMENWFANHAGKSVTYQNKPTLGIFAPFIAHPVTVWTRIDRIERLESGDLRVVIFKSGSRMVHPKELPEQLGPRIQAAAAAELLGSRVKQFAYVYLRTGRSLEIPLDKMNLENLKSDIRTIAQKIQDEDFPPEQGPLCSVCEFMPQCSGWKNLPWKIVSEDRDTYRERLRLSYSKMSLYERCPRAYSKLYNERIPPKPQPFFSFGSCIHAIMEDFYDKNEKRSRSVDFLMELLQKRWSEFRIGYRNPDEETRYHEKARDMLKKYYDRFVAGRKFKPAAFIEDYFEIPVGSDSIMTGFIDRIDKLPRKGYIVLDYKTEPTDRSQEAVNNDLQLTLYYWAAREFLKLDIRELGLFMMSHDKLMTTTRTPEDIPHLHERIIDVTRRIRQETEFAPKVNKYCMSCDHLTGCPLENDIRSRDDIRTMEFTDSDDEITEIGD